MKPLYKYGYWVHDPKTKDVKNHWEHRDGDAVHGSYSLLQPDGHMRIVEYTADKHNGFNAHVKYMYEGHGGGSSGGGGGGAAEDFGGGGEFGQHLDDLPGGQSQQFGGSRPKQSLNKYYKKPRAEKHGGPAGAYKRPNHFDGTRPKSTGGGHKKQQRLPPAEQSAEYYGGGGGRPNGHFDQLSNRFPSIGGSGGGSPEHYQAGPAVGGGGGGGGSPFGYSFGDQGPSNQPSSDHFTRKYSTLPASAETSMHHTGILQYQSSEHDPVHHRPDVAPAASTEHVHRGGAGGGSGGGADQQTQQPSRMQRSREDGDDDATGIRSMSDNDEDAAAEVRVQRQPLMEYHFEEPPYPFEIPEGLTAAAAMSGKVHATHQKRHLPQSPAPRYLTTSSYFPTWFGTAFDDFDPRLNNF